MFGSWFPKKSKLYRDFEKAFDAGKQDEFMHSLPLEKAFELMHEAERLRIDAEEQLAISVFIQNIENKSFPLGFGDN